MPTASPANPIPAPLSCAALRRFLGSVWPLMDFQANQPRPLSVLSTIDFHLPPAACCLLSAMASSSGNDACKEQGILCLCVLAQLPLTDKYFAQGRYSVSTWWHVSKKMQECTCALVFKPHAPCLPRAPPRFSRLLWILSASRQSVLPIRSPPHNGAACTGTISSTI